MGDILAAPLAAGEILFGYVLPAASMALLVSSLVLAMTALFVDLNLHRHRLSPSASPPSLPCSLPSSARLAGLWADRWEQYSLAENFVVLPLGFLSGTFFSLAALPEARPRRGSGQPGLSCGQRFSIWPDRLQRRPARDRCC